MTVTTSSNKVQWTGNGATYVFTYSFYIPATATVELIHTTAAGVQTVVAGAAFSITTGGATGGSLTYPLTGSPIPAGDTLTLVRIIPFTQPESLSNQGGLWPSAIEQGGLDNLELQIQQVNENVGRALQIPIGDPASTATLLPTAAARAGQMLVFDASGNATTAAIAGGLLSLLNYTGNPSVYQAGLIANPIASYSGFSWSFTTTKGNVSEIGLCIQMQSSTGLGTSVGTSGDKVGIYSAVQMNPGSGNGWAINPLIYLAPGSGIYGGSQVAEFDFANFSGYDYGDSGPLAGGPSSGGVQITGLGSNKGNYALGLFGNVTGSNPLWNVGVLTANNSIAQATIYDVCNATYGYQMFGTRQIGIDTTQATFGTGPIRIGNGQVIWSLNGAGSSSVQMIQVANNNYVVLGGVGSAGISCYGNTLPFTDNTYTCGASGFRWSAVWSATGTIQTSDPALKTDIEPIAGDVALKLLEAIDPITYRWRDGGTDLVDTEVEETVQAVEVVTYEAEEVQVRDGKAVRVTAKRTREVPLFDYLPVTDEAGNPVMTTFKEKRDDKGRVLIPAHTEQLRHAVPRMVTRKVVKPVPVSRPGKRLHWGWDALAIRDAFAAIGKDSGAYVLGEDGKHYHRPDQLVPVLWRAVQELAAEVAVLKEGPGR